MDNNLQIRTFSYKREDGVNPNTGFMSFQHFPGEGLYDDIVVLPENNMTETERVECYPVSPDAAEISCDDGYYPTSSVVYIRALWKEFEPEQGKYNYDFIGNLIDKAKNCGQTLLFRLMPHSTRACDDVPEWLKKIIDCPERPDGKRIKDSPTDPLFMELFIKAVKEIGKHFDENPYFEGIDVSFPGAWGEGHKLELYPDDILEKTVDTYVESFPNSTLAVQLSRPELVKRANMKTIAGFRGDGLGNPYHIDKRYPEMFDELCDMWKKAPVMFESYWWLGEWKRKGWDIDNIIEKTLSWHISSINAKSMPIPLEWKDKVEYWISKMGYHFQIDSFGCPMEAKGGSVAKFLLNVDNIGVAPCYKKYPLKMRLCGKDGIFDFDTGIDITKWLGGKTRENFEISLDASMPKGLYDVEIYFETTTGQTVYFCTDAKRNGKYYNVGSLTVC